MLRDNEAMYFLAPTDADASRRFYEGVLGLQLVADEHVGLQAYGHHRQERGFPGSGIR
jgi:catechol 2,3-dioxygenase-like lactoylglutathione lyase family enzyme